MAQPPSHQPPPPEGLPPAYEPGQFGIGAGAGSEDDYHSAYAEQRAASTAGEQGTLLPRNATAAASNDSDTDIDSLLESSDDDDEAVNAVRREIEEMEYMEPGNGNARDSRTSFSARASIASMRIATSLGSKFIAPVQRMLDPIATFFREIGIKFDTLISRVGNPLILKRLLYLVFVFVLIFVAFHFGLLPGSAKDAFVGGAEYHDPETLMEFLRDSINKDMMRDRLEYLSSMPHLAGTAGDLTLAKYVKEELFSFGMKQVGLTEHSAYITYPNETDSSIQLHLLGDNPFTATMVEDVLYDHPTEFQTQPRPFHAFSASGAVQGPLVYVNYGTKQDFEFLKKSGIAIEGCIVLMRNGKMETGLKVKLAELAGALGVVTFTDRPFSNLDLWPDGPDYPMGAVERSSMAISALVPGDLLSPGYSSISSQRVVGEDQINNVPKIPAVPVSWKDVEPFLAAVKGYGVEMQGSDVPRIESWWSGNQSAPEAKLVNYPIIKHRHPIWNVLGKLDGQEQKDLAIIIGAKRDSWCYGAVGPMSGTSVLLEVARIFTLMSAKLQWKPLRTIYFASWDGGDQNLAGTTEWVEFNMDTLRSKGVAYINLDDAISGQDLEVKGHPMLQTIVKHVLEQVKDPVRNQTIAHYWTPKDMKPFDEIGDYLPFSAYAGIPSLQLSFKGARYPKHSCFDSFEWMSKYGDPAFEYHQTIVDIISKLILSLSDDPIIPFDMGAYADALDLYSVDLENYAKTQESWPTIGAKLLDLSILKQGANKIRTFFNIFVGFRADWTTITANSGETPSFMQMRWAWNNRLVNLDKMILSDDNNVVNKKTELIPNRPWFKHPIFGPQLWHPTEGDFLWGTFPGIRDAIEKGDWNLAMELVNRTGAKILLGLSHLHG